MWVRLEDEEINQILRLIPAGPLADKLREKPHPNTSAFVGAVETDDELEVDPDAVISRGDDGAFVMSWSWVSNEQAGFHLFEDDDNLSISADQNPAVLVLRCHPHEASHLKVEAVNESFDDADRIIRPHIIVNHLRQK